MTVETDAGGVATFTDLALTGASGSYTITFSAPDLTERRVRPGHAADHRERNRPVDRGATWPIVAIHTMLLPDGRVLAINRIQTPQVWDPATGNFEPVSAPANLFCAGHALLPDGRVFIAGGHIDDNQGLPNLTIFSATTDAFTSLPPMAHGRWYPTTTVLANGDVVILAGKDQNMAEVPCPSSGATGP